VLDTQLEEEKSRHSQSGLVLCLCLRIGIIRNRYQPIEPIGLCTAWETMARTSVCHWSSGGYEQVSTDCVCRKLELKSLLVESNDDKYTT